MRQAFTWSYFRSTSIHLITRHQHRAKTAGHLAPLTTTSWIYFLVTAFSLMTIRSHHYYSFRATTYALVISNTLLFSFSLFYNQDFRSSTIEPLYEELPQRIIDVNLGTQIVVTMGFISFSDHIHKSADKRHSLIVNTQKRQYEFCSHKPERWCTIPYIPMWNMAKSPDYFLLTSKQVYEELLGFQEEIMSSHKAPLTYDDGTFMWQWRISPKVSQYQPDSIISFKQRRWNEPLKIFLTRVMVNRLFYELKLFIFFYPTRILICCIHQQRVWLCSITSPILLK